jgi:hypothetical protein
MIRQKPSPNELSSCPFFYILFSTFLWRIDVKSIEDFRGIREYIKFIVSFGFDRIGRHSFSYRLRTT